MYFKQLIRILKALSDILWILLENACFFKCKERVNFDFAENTVKTIAQRAATSIQYRCSLSHNFVLSEYFRSKHISAYRLDYTDKNYSMCLTLMIFTTIYFCGLICLAKIN